MQRTATPSFVTSLGSRKSYLQIFLGQTFKNTYDGEDPEGSNEFKNVGFGNGGQLVRLTFNTMWRLQGHSCTESTDCTRNRDNRFRNGLFHTDAHLEFSKFPFGLNTEEEGDGDDSGTGDDTGDDTGTGDGTGTTAGTDRGLENAFTGSLGLTWEPNRWTSYDKRDDMDLIPGDDAPYDAYRFGLFTKMGATTRAKSEPGGNTSINRIQFGLRFTHTRSKFSRPSAEERNEVPIRFVEMSFARFSDWGAGPTANDGAPRLVFDAGLRITALSNEVFPIYVGAHFNTGPGEDDLRVFVGMLIKLDLLGRLVQGIAGPPPKPK